MVAMVETGLSQNVVTFVDATYSERKILQRGNRHLPLGAVTCQHLVLSI